MDIAVANEAVSAWLKTSFPGGKHIGEHWRDGPYFLVPVTDAELEGAYRRAEIVRLLSAHEPVATGLPYEAGGQLKACSVYAVGEFTAELMSRNADRERGNIVDMRRSIGPFDEVPGTEQTLESLVELLGSTHKAGPELQARLDQAHAALLLAGPERALTALAAMTGAGQDPYDTSLVALLERVAATIL